MPSDAQILDRVREIKRKSQYLRYGFERDIFRNLLFKQGHQWVVWDGTTRRFRQKKLKSWVPMPVTNKFAELLDALASLILRVDPPMQWRCLDDQDEVKKSIAETATAALERARDRVHFANLRQELATWLVYSGNGFLVNSYDPTGGHTYKIPLHECHECHNVNMPVSFEDGCEQCGSQNHNVQLKNGVPQEQELTGGAEFTEVATPFEMFMDFSITQWHMQPEALRVKTRQLPYFAERYGAKGKKVQSSGSSTLGEFYAASMAYMSSGAGISPAATIAQKMPTAAEECYWVKPCNDFKDGLYLICAGDVILEKGTLSCKNHLGERFIPVQHIVFDPILGSAMGKTVANDLAPKQKQRNELESLIQLITMRMANPVWIVPYGTDVEGFSGQPGALLKAIQLSPNASGEPKRLPGENVPSSVMQWLDKIDSDLESLASMFDALKGEAPPGITAGYAIQLLIERGQSRWGPLFQRWETGWMDWAANITAYQRAYMPADELLMILGPHGTWEVQKFKEDDFSVINLHVEPNSAKPTSAITQQAILDNLLGKGLIDTTDPHNKSEILRMVGMSKFDNQSDWDMKDAAREEQAFLDITKVFDLAAANQRIQQLQMVNPEAAQMEAQKVQAIATQGALRFRPQIDNNVIHLWSHKKFAKTDAFLKLPAEWQAVFITHIEQTAMQILQENQQMAMLGAPQQGGPPGKPSPGASGKPPAPQSEKPGELAASPKGGHAQMPAMSAGVPGGS